jgi:hypothetical protein
MFVRMRASSASASRPRRWRLLCLAGAVVLLLVIPGAGWAQSTVAVDGEAVLNPSAATDLSGWTADSDAGAMTLNRVSTDGDPSGATTAIDVQRPAVASGRWSFALATLAGPETFFQAGHAYQIRAYVRDLWASGGSIGLLLANANYRHRPTAATVRAHYGDRSWHLLVRTFICTGAASSDTALHFSLPGAGALHWQLTAASVREVSVPGPARVGDAPTQVVSFDGPAGAPPDPAAWNHDLGGGGWGSNQLQTYTDRPENSQLDGAGHLIITARREDATGPDGIPRQYTSARLTTQGKVVVPAGSYVEAPIEAPVGAGVWPAFWLLGSNITEVGWPACGELDVVEVVGARPTIAHSATHQAAQSDPTLDAPYGWDEAGGTVDLGHSLDSRSHLYGVYFDGETVRFYIDRVEHMALWASDALTSGRTWPFGNPGYLLLNVAVGGIGDPSATEFPRSMTVGAISVWQGGIPF